MLAASESVRLFTERATAVSPAFALTEANIAKVAEICQRLDGIPLAIELAAARVPVLSVDEILERLGDRFRLLTGGRRTAVARQQTLQALVDWSWDLLPEEDRRLLRRLSVFAGGWTLEAATAVCGTDESDGSAVLDALTQLVERSLVVVESGTSTRYRLLDTVRTLPGVESVSFGRRIPLGFIGPSSSGVTVEGISGENERPRFVNVNYAGPDYLRQMRIPLVTGRDLSMSDVAGQPAVAIVSETMAKIYWGDKDPVGSRFVFGRPAPGQERWITVVGVAKDIKQRSMTERSQPLVFLPVLQSGVTFSNTFLIRPSAPTMTVVLRIPSPHLPGPQTP
jgi:hypothetical protein